ncbi:MAG: hypothetical protein WBW47_05805 [Thermoplasmata archaeon]
MTKRGRPAPTTALEATEKAFAALRQAHRNVGTARVLSDAGRYPEAFRSVVEAAEETFRYLAYFAVSLGLWTFNAREAGPKQYLNEADLYHHERKHAYFFALELLAATIELIAQTIARGPEAAKKLGEEMNTKAESKADADRFLQARLPSVLVLLESVFDWEERRQAAPYSGEDARGNPIYPATREEFERTYPVVANRLARLEEWSKTLEDPKLLASAKRLMIRLQKIRKGSKRPRPGRLPRSRSGPRTESSAP